MRRSRLSLLLCLIFFFSKANGLLRMQHEDREVENKVSVPVVSLENSELIDPSPKGVGRDSPENKKDAALGASPPGCQHHESVTVGDGSGSTLWSEKQYSENPEFREPESSRILLKLSERIPMVYESQGTSFAKDPHYPSKTMAVVQSGLLDTWIYTSTIENVVRPLTALDWKVFYFVRLQRNFKGLVRWTGADLDGIRLHQDQTDEEICKKFLEELGAAGGVGTCQIFPESARPIFQKLTREGVFSAKRKPQPVMVKAEVTQYWQVHETMLHAQRYLVEKGVDHVDWVLRVREDAGWYIQPPFHLLEREGTDNILLRGCMCCGVSDKVELLPWKYALSWSSGMATGYYTLQAHDNEPIVAHNTEHLMIAVMRAYNLPHKDLNVLIRNDTKRNTFNIIANGTEVSNKYELEKFALPVTDARIREDGTMCFVKFYACRPEHMAEEDFPIC